MLCLGIRLDADHERNRDKRHVYFDVLEFAVVVEAEIFLFEAVDVVAVAIEHQGRSGYEIDAAAEDQFLARLLGLGRGRLRVLLRSLLPNQHPAQNQYKSDAERITPVEQQHVPFVLSAVRAREAPTLR